jgi:uncharacterized coiled-coil protein SlyX
MDETGTVVVTVAGGGVVGWLVSRFLNKPDEQSKEIAAIRERVIRLESRIGAEGDVGTLMHVLNNMQTQMDAMQKSLQLILNQRGGA